MSSGALNPSVSLTSARKSHVTLLLACAFYAHSAGAIGLGAVRVDSDLGKPLQAFVSLHGNDTDNLAGACFNAKLLSPDGVLIARPRITHVQAMHASSLSVTTTTAVNEPAVTLLVEVACKAGIQRSYDILLDPPISVFTPAAQPDTMVAGAVPPPDNRFPNNRRERLQGQSNAGRSARALTPPPPAQEPVERTKRQDKAARSVLRLSSAPLPELAAGHNGNLKLAMAMSLSEKSLLHTQDVVDDGNKTLHGGEMPAQLKGAPLVESEPNENKLRALEEKVQALETNAAALKEARANAADALEIFQRQNNLRNLVTSLSVLLLSVLLSLAWLIWRIRQFSMREAAANWARTQSAANAEEALNEKLTSSLQFDQNDNHVNATERQSVASDSMPEPCEAPEQLVSVKQDVPDQAIEKTLMLPATAAMQSGLAEGQQGANLGPEVKPSAVSEPACNEAPMASNLLEQSALPNFRNKSVDTRLQQRATLRRSRSQQGGKKMPVSGAAATNKPVHDFPVIQPVLVTEELSNVTQVAEFWVSLGQPARAAQVLETYTDVNCENSPLPSLYLFDLYRELGAKKKYQALLAAFRTKFNSKMPDWEEYLNYVPLRTLEDMPHLINRIVDVWHTEDAVRYLKGLLVCDRDEGREGFELSVYREILFLLSIAEENAASRVLATKTPDETADTWG